MSQKILIGPCVCGFLLSEAVVADLFAHYPDLFDEPTPLSDFGAQPPGMRVVPQVLDFTHCVLVGDQIHFLLETPELRSHPLLLAKYEAVGSAGMVRRPSATIKMLEIPDDVSWDIVSAEDGSEYVAERHRIWQ
jgi:hypothetical protein